MKNYSKPNLIPNEGLTFEPVLQHCSSGNKEPKNPCPKGYTHLYYLSGRCDGCDKWVWKRSGCLSWKACPYGITDLI